jgi:hypothetical protein
MNFYKATEKLDGLKKVETPTEANLLEMIEICAGDTELTLYFYDKNLGSEWLEMLDGASEFKELGSKEAGIVEKFKAHYVVECAESKPEAVLEIIKKVKAKDRAIQGILLDAVLKMSEKVGERSVPVVLDYLDEREYKIWYFVGEAAGKLMVKLVDKQPKEALKIAKVLLDVWWPGEEARSSLDNIRARFATNEYKRLMFDFYRKIWEKRPFDATSMLVEVFDAYIDEYNKEKDYDTSEHMGVSVEDLQNIERLDYHLEAIVIKGICEAGGEVIVKEKARVRELMDDLEKRQKAIFYRIMMYLLRFVDAETERDRINRMIGNGKFTENWMYRYEHRRLLNDKFEEVNEEVKKAFVEWVGKEKIGEEKRKEITEWCSKNKEEKPDFEKMENREKAEELYLVRERFKELYEEYKVKASIKEDQVLAPRRMVSEARHVSPMEGTPLQPEAMAKMTVNEVLDFILEPKNYEEKKTGGWREPAEALGATFKEDVKKRPMEYLKECGEKLAKLPAEFMSGFFYGIHDTVRDGSFEKEGWGDLIELAHGIVDAKQKEETYRNCFSGMLSMLRDVFSERENKIEFDEDKVKKFWEIIEPLVHFPIGDRSELGEERDPVQIHCNVTAGQALELTVPLGIVCKRDFKDMWEKYLKGERRKCYEYVLSEIRQPGVNCLFGLDFARIYWTDQEWVEEKIENIFCTELWDETWGTYVSWGRPSQDGFKFLVEKGMYNRAVDRTGTKNKYKFQKEPEEGLVEHLMIGFFNGWIELDSDLLKKFFEKGSSELRGNASRFLTTGFNSVNEGGGEEKEKAAKRMKEYWEKRLAAIAEKQEENFEEAVEFTGWVEDSLLGAEETLELLEKSLDLSGGKFGKMRDAKDFVDGVCELGKGHELLALRCLKKAAGDENLRTPWALHEARLVEFLGQMADLKGEDVKEIQDEAIIVADLYGRLHPDKFRDVWEKLRKRQAT